MFETSSPLEAAVVHAIQLSQSITVISIIVFIACLVLFKNFKRKAQKMTVIVLMIISLAGASCGIPLIFLLGIQPFGTDDETAISAYQNALNTSILPDMTMAMSASLGLVEPNMKKADSLIKNALKLAKTPELKSEICRSFGVRAANMRYTSLAFKYFDRAYKYQKPASYEWIVVALIYWRNGKQVEAEKIYSALESNGLEVKRPY